MISENHITELEHALLARARNLAQEYLGRADTGREQIIRDTNYHLRLREEREMLAAKSLGDRTYRQLTQAGELQLQADMDRLRFALIQGVMLSALEEIKQFTRDEQRYLPVLGQFLARSAQAIEDKPLIVRVNAADHKRLNKRWESWSAEYVPHRQVMLDEETLDCIGGLIVQDEAGRERIDQTFEGRLERLEMAVQQVAVQRLFATLPEAGGLLNG